MECDKMVDKVEYKIPTTNLIPPEGWKTQLKFQLVGKGRTTPLLLVQDFTYNIDISTSTGDGTLTLALDNITYMKLRDNDEFQLFWGWSKNGDLEISKVDTSLHYIAMEEPQPVLEYDERMNMDTEHIPLVLTGYIKDVKRSGDKLVIDFFDKGVLLEGTDPAMNWPLSDLGYIVEDIAERAGISVVIDWAGDPAVDITMTYPPASETATGTTGTAAPADTTTAPPDATTTPATTPDTTGCICITCVKVSGCADIVAYKAEGEHCWENVCPFDQGTLFNISNPSGEHWLRCSKCGSDFCGKTGWDLAGANSPNGPGKDCAKKLTPCGGSVGGGGGTSKASSSYWETLTKVLIAAKADLMAFVHLDTLYVLRIPNSDKPPIFIDDRLNVVQDSVTVTDPRPDKVNKIIVSYGSTALKQTVYASYPDMVMKYGEKVQELQQPKLNAKDATDYAVKQLNMANRTDGFSIDCTILGTPYYYPNHWCNTLLTRYNVDKVMFLSRYVLKFSADKIPTADISLVEYYPDLTVQTTESNDLTGTGTGDLTTLDVIMKSAAKYHYAHSCSDAGCLVSTGVGDCYAMSDYIYNKLTSAGIRAHILWYQPNCSGNHRSVEYWANNAWVPVPYRQYGLDTMFNDTKTKCNVRVYKGG